LKGKAPTDVRIILASNLIEIMSEKGFSARAMSIQIKMSPRTFAHILKAISYTRIDTIAEIAHALDIEPWRLLAPNLGKPANNFGKTCE
jgi:lambda repressor-like predicted transcriptional regulator